MEDEEFESELSLAQLRVSCSGWDLEEVLVVVVAVVARAGVGIGTTTVGRAVVGRKGGIERSGMTTAYPASSTSPPNSVNVLPVPFSCLGGERIFQVLLGGDDTC